MLDVWADNSDGLTPPFNDKDDGYLNSYNSALAYHAYLLDNDNDRHYYSPHSNGWHDPNYVGGYGEIQEFVSKTKGGLNTWDLAISGNYADKLLFGASISLSTLRYKQTSTYSEDDDLGHFPYQHWDFDETIKITGGGVNLKAGVIYKPVNYLRFGAEIHTPTWYRIIDKYYTELKVSYDKQAVDDKLVAKEQEEWLSPDEPYKYNLMTPFKAILSGAFIFPARGLLSVDYEYVNYSMTEYSNEDFDKHSFKEQNRAIEKKYEGAHNLRAGLEVKCTPNIALRAGYAVYGNPCKNVDKTFDRQIISGGIGFGDEDVFFDITGSYHLFETTEILYESANFYQDYNSKDKALYITMTLGLRF
jgi:long-subunit fatty acid transport protein